ncbi:MAG: hypothetical protein ABFD83_14775 [Armatimonadota bacterium]
MGLGAAGAKNGENFNTYVSLTGVETFQRGSRIIGGCFKGMTGDANATQAAFKRVGISGGEMMMAGAMISGAGAGILAYMHKATEAAAMQAAAERRLRTALTASGKGGAAAAKEVDRYAKSLEDTTAVGDEQLINAAAVLASFHMGSKEIKDYLPRMLDMQEGLKKLGGEEMSLEQIAIMLGKGHMGMITALRRVGVMVDENRYKQIGYKAILEELDKKFKGQATEAAKGYGGAIEQLDVEINSLNESMGAGMLPILTSTNKVLKPLVKSFTTLNEHTGGAAGAILFAAGALAVVGGGITLIMPGLQALRNMWIEIAIAARGAGAAQKAAATAGAGSGATAAASGAGTATGAAAATGAGAAGAKSAASAGFKGVIGKVLGSTIGRIGVGIIGALAGGAISSATSNDKDIEKWAKTPYGSKARVWGGLKLLGGGALGGGVAGAAAGYSFGGPWGAAAGAVIGAVKGMYDAKSKWEDVQKKVDSERGTTGQINPKSRTNELLEQLVKLGKDQKAILIGGGKRMQGRYNQGDLMRALYGAMGTGVIG